MISFDFGDVERSIARCVSGKREEISAFQNFDRSTRIVLDT